MRTQDAISSAPSLPWRGSLFRKYVLTLVSLVAVVLTINAAVETWFLYRETVDRVARVQAAYAAAAVAAVEETLAEIERQVGWVTRASAQSLAQHREDYAALLDQTPIVLTLAFYDDEGRERIRARRPNGPAPIASADLGPVPPRKGFQDLQIVGSEIYASLLLPHPAAGTGVTLARVRLAALAGSLPASTAGAESYADLVTSDGIIVTHSGGSPHAAGDRLALSASDSVSYASDAAGRPVLATQYPLDVLPATIVVAQPLNEALAPLRDLLIRLAWLLAFGLVVAICASLLLARRMLVPIRALHAGAEHFAANRFEHRIAVHTGDELGALATRFNTMADALSTSYARLESEIQRQTRDLARSVSELQALEETGRAIVASLQIDDVVRAIAARAATLAGSDASAVYLVEAPGESFRRAGGHGLPLAAVSDILPGNALAQVGDAAAEIVPIRDLAMIGGLLTGVEDGFRAATLINLADSDGRLGFLLLLVYDDAAPPGGSEHVLHTFAHQAALALRNARLFQEVDEKGRQLAAADLHKTQFFANMSHELRTPLNAVLGYSELLADGLYGALSEKASEALERIQINGRHLLSLINDVLDFTKIEAGLLTVNFQDYSLGALIESVTVAAASLADAKGLALKLDVPTSLPIGQADERRLTQVLMNLVGNAIKFTQSGSVEVAARAVDGSFVITISDTGPGISPADQARIFDEFQQVDSSSTRQQGGTGLGLSIARRLVLLHGGRIEVRSELGQGAVFQVTLPIRPSVERKKAS
ncbi:Signal transduction histidine kinase [Methylobacterium pseudosasicola]|uniref:histidine kinase n=1 Tax=Methylobacterium pseudosasicola TaxID=582667 RepID=A0A1I4RB59_9HYPH|nr:Signal transduction histidine kinase [Methylobacterium pseudosasicola]